MTGVAVVASFAARHFYFQYKQSLLSPIQTGVYQRQNQKLLELIQQTTDLKNRLVLIGDSRVQNWKFNTEDAKWMLLNRGIGGETTAQLLYRFEKDALSLKPKIIVIQAGINDLVAAVSPTIDNAQLIDTVGENLKKLAVCSANHGVITILTTIIPPGRPNLIRRAVWRNTIYEDVRVVNRNLLRWKAPKGVLVLDLSSSIGENNALPGKFSSDCLHLNQRGYDQLNKLLLPALQNLMDGNG